MPEDKMQKTCTEKCQKMKIRTKCMLTRTITLILGHTLTITGPFLPLSLSLHTPSLYPSNSIHTNTLCLSIR